MHAVPTVSTPGVFSPEEKSPAFTISDVQEAVRNEPEISEALDDLVYSLEHGIHKGRAFDAFEERIFALYLRTRLGLQDQEVEPDEGWEHA